MDCSQYNVIQQYLFLTEGIDLNKNSLQIQNLPSTEHDDTEQS